MQNPTSIYDLLTEEDAAEHKRLAKLIKIQALALSPATLSLTEIATLKNVSKERVRQIQASALFKVKKEIINNQPDLIQEIRTN